MNDEKFSDKNIILQSGSSWVLSTLYENIKNINNDVITVNESGLSTIQAGDLNVFSLGDGEKFEEAASTFSPTGVGTISSADTIYYAEMFGNLTGNQATKIYEGIRDKDARLPINYELFKAKVMPNRLYDKLKKIIETFNLTEEDIKKCFKILHKR